MFKILQTAKMYKQLTLDYDLYIYKYFNIKKMYKAIKLNSIE